MKKSKILSFVFSLALVSSMSALSASAETIQQDGLTISLTTDKEQYSSADNITTKIQVTNNNQGSVYEVQMDNIIPDGYAIAKGSAKVKAVSELKAGETIELESVFSKKQNNNIVPTSNLVPTNTVSQTGTKHTGTVSTSSSINSTGSSTSNNSTTDNPKTGNSDMIPYAVAALSSAVLIIATKKGKGKKLFSFILCGTMLLSTIPITGFRVSAIGDKTADITVNVQIGNETVAVSASVAYSFVQADKKFDENNVGEIYYLPVDAEHIALSEDGFTMYADNEVLLVAKKGVSKTEIMNLAASYDAEVVGFIEQTGDYQLKISNVRTESELNSLVDELRANNLVADAYLNYIAEMTECAVEDDVILGSQWSSNMVSLDLLSKDNPNDNEGLSWGVEVINAPEAWQYMNEHKSDINPVRIGLIDSGFDETHSDLSFAEVFYDNGANKKTVSTEQKSHGTHVAGTMAATGTNRIGINGVYPYGAGMLYGVSTGGFSQYNENKSFWTSSMRQKVTYAELIVRNVKVINQSQGFNWQQFFDKEDDDSYTDNSKIAEEVRANYDDLDALYNGFQSNDDYSTQKKVEAEKYADFLKRTLDLGYDFVIISAAGNTHGRESKFNSYNCLIPNTEECRDVYNRIIVVGSTGNGNNVTDDNGNTHFEFSTKYGIRDTSDAGERVDIFAPGCNIYSTVPTSNQYDVKSGTSMAAPHVAGVCANVWSMNNNLTGEQVKQIVCGSHVTDENNHDRVAYTYTDTDGHNHDKYIVDCEKAVREAVRTTGESDNPQKEYGSVQGWVVEKNEDGSIATEKNVKIGNATIKVYTDDAKHNQVSVNGVSEWTTDEFGHYELLLEEGNYVIEASHSAYTGEDAKPSVHVSVKSQQVCYPEWIELKKNVLIIVIDPTETDDITEPNEENTESIETEPTETNDITEITDAEKYAKIVAENPEIWHNLNYGDGGSTSASDIWFQDLDLDGTPELFVYGAEDSSIFVFQVSDDTLKQCYFPFDGMTNGRAGYLIGQNLHLIKQNDKFSYFSTLNYDDEHYVLYKLTQESEPTQFYESIVFVKQFSRWQWHYFTGFDYSEMDYSPELSLSELQSYYSDYFKNAVTYATETKKISVASYDSMSAEEQLIVLQDSYKAWNYAPDNLAELPLQAQIIESTEDNSKNDENNKPTDAQKYAEIVMNNESVWLDYMNRLDFYSSNGSNHCWFEDLDFDGTPEFVVGGSDWDDGMYVSLGNFRYFIYQFTEDGKMKLVFSPDSGAEQSLYTPEFLNSVGFLANYKFSNPSGGQGFADMGMEVIKHTDTGEFERVYIGEATGGDIYSFVSVNFSNNTVERNWIADYDADENTIREYTESEYWNNVVNPVTDYMQNTVRCISNVCAIPCTYKSSDYSANGYGCYDNLSKEDKKSALMKSFIQFSIEETTDESITLFNYLSGAEKLTLRN